jgi:hypothetical protein
MLKPDALGQCTVIASQAGTNDYAAAPDVSQTISVQNAPRIVSFEPSVAGPISTRSLTLVLTFADATTGLTASDFIVGSSGCVVGSPSTSDGGVTYDVPVTACHDGDASIQLRVNSVTNGVQGPSTVAVSTPITIDTVAPSVTSITTSTLSPTNAASIAYAVTFS